MTQVCRFVFVFYLSQPKTTFRLNYQLVFVGADGPSLWRGWTCWVWLGKGKATCRAIHYGGDGYAVNTNVIMLMGGGSFCCRVLFQWLKRLSRQHFQCREETTERLKKKVHSHQSTICWIFNAGENMDLNVENSKEKQKCQLRRNESKLGSKSNWNLMKVCMLKRKASALSPIRVGMEIRLEIFTCSCT